jgi:hypothetical protein
VSEDWTKEGGRYIPGPEPWLNNQRWEACPKPARAVGPAVEMHPAYSLKGDDSLAALEADTERLRKGASRG